MVQTRGFVAPFEPVREEPKLGALEARAAAAPETSSDEPVGDLGLLVTMGGSQGSAGKPCAPAAGSSSSPWRAPQDPSKALPTPPCFKAHGLL